MRSLFFNLKIALLALLVGAFMVCPAGALTVTLGLDAVRASDGSFVLPSSLALIVVQNGSGAFPDLRLGDSLGLDSYISGSPGNGNYIAWKGNFDGTTPGAGNPGVFFNPISFQIDTANVPKDASFAIYWFPSLTTAATTLTTQTSYGFYTSTNASQFGSDHAWNVGSDNSATFSLNAFSQDNTGVYAPIDPDPNGLPDVVLTATHVVAVPEASTVALLALALGSGVFLRKIRCSWNLRL